MTDDLQVAFIGNPCFVVCFLLGKCWGTHNEGFDPQVWQNFNWNNSYISSPPDFPPLYQSISNLNFTFLTDMLITVVYWSKYENHFGFYFLVWAYWTPFEPWMTTAGPPCLSLSFIHTCRAVGQFVIWHLVSNSHTHISIITIKGSAQMHTHTLAFY